MASPNACGCIALMLSGLQQRGLPLPPPHQVRRICRATARTIEGVHPRAQGGGLMQVDAAFELLVQAAEDSVGKARFQVAVQAPGGRCGRGVYLRDRDATATPSTHVVTVTPRMHEDAPKRELVEFEALVALKSDAEWVQSPENVALAAKAKTFKVVVDPTQLPPGDHCANVFGYDTSRPGSPALFAVPVMVVVGHPLQRDAAGRHLLPPVTIELKRGQDGRTFVIPPPGCSWMDISIRMLQCEPAGHEPIVVLHTVQMQPDARFSCAQTQNYLRLAAGGHDVVSRSVNGGSAIELCTTLCGMPPCAPAARLSAPLSGTGLRPGAPSSSSRPPFTRRARVPSWCLTRPGTLKRRLTHRWARCDSSRSPR